MMHIEIDNPQLEHQLREFSKQHKSQIEAVTITALQGFFASQEEKWSYWQDEEIDNFGKIAIGLSRHDYDDEDYSKW
ncbi:MAG: hypothetical protein JXQ76_11095 [Campylobacterales bacterium]|nr:hypothetical protein [Campylobacterales bacterium]